jgi:hypothetical protein
MTPLSSVASVEVFEEFQGPGEDRQLIGYTKKVKLWDKNAAIDKLMRPTRGREASPTHRRQRVQGLAHLGVYKRDNEQKVDALTALLEQFWAQQPGVLGAIKQPT